MRRHRRLFHPRAPVHAAGGAEEVLLGGSERRHRIGTDADLLLAFCPHRQREDALPCTAHADDQVQQCANVAMSILNYYGMDPAVNGVIPRLGRCM